VVLAHEVRFTDLYRHGEARDAVPEGYAAAARAMYPGLPDGWLAQGWIDSPVAQRNGVLMAREVIGLSRRFLVTSDYAAHLARIDAHPGDTGRIDVLPFAFPEGPSRLERPPVGPGGRLLVGSFGIVNSLKQPELLVEALHLLRSSGVDAELVFVGPAGETEGRMIAEAAGAHGLQGLVRVTGHVERHDYSAWMQKAAVAVQLRAGSNGEASAAVADCLTHGVPTIVSATGPARSLPAFVRKVPATVNAPELADALRDALGDTRWREQASVAGLRYAGERGFPQAAEKLLELLGLGLASR
jgi:glycosyltransferase involved in cell wall biosynthesis